MLSTICLFAVGGDSDIFSAAPGTSVGRGTGLVMQELLWIIAAALAVLLSLMVWAKYFRRSHHRRHRHHQPAPTPASAGEPGPGPQAEADEDTRGQRRHHRSRRRRRRDHRVRNPTLAETGGLPPLRPGAPPSSSPPS